MYSIQGVVSRPVQDIHKVHVLYTREGLDLLYTTYRGRGQIGCVPPDLLYTTYKAGSDRLCTTNKGGRVRTVVYYIHGRGQIGCVPQIRGGQGILHTRAGSDLLYTTYTGGVRSVVYHK